MDGFTRAAMASGLALATAGAAAQVPEPDAPYRPEPVFTQASELLPWCRQEAEARYVARNIQTYQWTASYKQSGNVLYVEGKLRAHGDDVPVRCRVARNARERYRERYAVIEIDDPVLSEVAPPGDR